jgi:hypothetical protein
METLTLNFTKIEYLVRENSPVTQNEKTGLQLKKAQTTN